MDDVGERRFVLFFAGSSKSEYLLMQLWSGDLATTPA